MFYRKGSGSDVVKLVTAYESSVYRMPNNFKSTNGYEQRRQGALAMTSTKVKAAATASALALVQAKLMPGESTDGAVFFPSEGKPMGRAIWWSGRTPTCSVLGAVSSVAHGSVRSTGCQNAPFQIAAAEATAAVRFVLDVHDERGAVRFGAGVDGVGVVDDQVDAVGFVSAELVGLFAEGVFAGGAEHQHPAAKGQFGVHDGVVLSGMDGVFFEAEDAAEPVDGGRRVVMECIRG